jgi:uncharacterized membrane protein YczE
MGRALFYRWLFFISGLIVLALGFTLIIKADRLGIGPWDVLNVGLFEKFGLTIGTWAILVGLAVIVSTMMFTRKIPQIGTFLNMLLIGIFIDIFNWMIPDVELLAAQIAMFVIGLFIGGYGVGLYVAPRIGAGPRDSLMLLLVEKTGLSISVIRTSMEISVAFIGWLLGGPVGIGTIAVALFTGKIVQISLPQFERLLKRIIEKGTDVPPVLKI